MRHFFKNIFSRVYLIFKEFTIQQMPFGNFYESPVTATQENLLHKIYFKEIFFQYKSTLLQIICHIFEAEIKGEYYRGVCFSAIMCFEQVPSFGDKIHVEPLHQIISHYIPLSPLTVDRRRSLGTTYSVQKTTNKQQFKHFICVEVRLKLYIQDFITSEIFNIVNKGKKNQ